MTKASDFATARNDGWQRIDGRAHYIGKELPEGPWHAEPDHLDFEAHRFACILHRGPVGAWCGYVAVPPGHPWHGKGYDEVRLRGDEDAWPEVHGGLTYAERCQGAICHVTTNGPDDVWWLGFDCCHSGDLMAFDLRRNDDLGVLDGFTRHGEYRTLSFVRAQTEHLAEQARAEVA